jgi:hypothetical protein
MRKEFTVPLADLNHEILVNLTVTQLFTSESDLNLPLTSSFDSFETTTDGPRIIKDCAHVDIEELPLNDTSSNSIANNRCARKFANRICTVGVAVVNSVTDSESIR